MQTYDYSSVDYILHNRTRTVISSVNIIYFDLISVVFPKFFGAAQHFAIFNVLKNNCLVV